MSWGQEPKFEWCTASPINEISLIFFKRKNVIEEGKRDGRRRLSGSRKRTSPSTSSGRLAMRLSNALSR